MKNNIKIIINFIFSLIFLMIYYIVDNKFLPWFGLVMLVVFLYFFWINKKNIDSLFLLVSILLLVSAISMGQAVFGVVDQIYPGGDRYIPNNIFTQNKAFYLICLSIFCIVPFLKCHKNFYYSPNNKTNKKTVYILMLLIGIATIMGNPVTSLFTASYGSQDYGGELYGAGLIGGWRSIVIVLYGVYAVKTQLKKKRELIFSGLLICYWLIHGSRAEIIGVLFCIFAMNYSRISLIKRYWLIFFLIASVAIFQLIGDIRGLSSIEIDTLIKLIWENKIFLSDGALYISTVDPINYSLLALVYALDNNIMNYSYFDYFGSFLTRTLPSTWDFGLTQSKDLAVILDEEMSAKGGCHFIGEAYYSFGAFGVILYSFSVFYLMSRVRSSQKKSEIGSIYYWVLFMLAFRYVWYGSIYLYKVIILFIVIYFCRLIFKNISSKNSNVLLIGE